jgi:hypothetical protein
MRRSRIVRGKEISRRFYNLPSGKSDPTIINGMVRRFRVRDHSPRIVEFRCAPMNGENRVATSTNCPSYGQVRGCFRWKPVSCHFAELRGWKSVIIHIGCTGGMKSKSCTIWVLGALMVLASLDAVLDPPAVNPRTVNFASRLYEAPGGLCERRLNCDWSCTSSHFQIHWIVFTSTDEPNLPSDWIALTGRAADPSPPALEARRNLYFQS